MELVSVSVDTLADPVEQAVNLCQTALLNEHKILCCGNGPGAVIAELFSMRLLHRFEYDRPSLPAISLSANGATLSALAAGSSGELYARQIRAIGQPGDLLLVVSANDNNNSLVQAVRAAHERDMLVVLLSGGECKDVSSLIAVDDIEIFVNSSSAPRIIEVQTVIVHCLCKLIDQALFGIYNA